MRTFCTFILILFITSIGLTQTDIDRIFKDKDEIYFRFDVLNKADINSFTDIISIDNVKGNTVYAYANKEDFQKFLYRNTRYEILKHPGELIIPEMSDNPDDIKSWDVYPTYDGYIAMMNQFASMYPSLCTIIDAGTTTQGRKILFAKISDNVSTREPEPQFMFSSSMHGDEITAYVLMLRLIDSLLTSYGSDPRITNLINNVEIWINPLANPDGTYRSGNHTVSGAIRGNALLVDINRNFPDPQNGPHPDGKAWQLETIAMMDLSAQNNFVLSANFHGGAEVVNYPWDTWAPLHADDSWFRFISHLYADTAQANSPSGYMSGFDDGITNGYAWYEVNGGRQDFFNYFRRCREVTIEISNTKLPPASQLPAFWNYNKKSFLTYIENTLYGIRGIVTDTSGNPVKAFVSITGHDTDSSQIFSHPVTGDYYRMIAPGTYNLTFSAPGFFQQTVNNISVTAFQAVNVDVELIPDGTPVELFSFSASVEGNNIQLQWQTASEMNNKGFEVERRQDNQEWKSITFINGYGTSTDIHTYSYTDINPDAAKYFYRLKQIDLNGSYSFSDEIEVQINIIADFILFQNYPNPFNPLTKIKYQLPENGHVSLIIFDLIGNEVSELINCFQNAGLYETEFDGSKISSGIYYYQFKSGNYMKTKKFILLK
jgi:5-hydroxyisourate hydrolase-like protein (transthyretin family)